MSVATQFPQAEERRHRARTRVPWLVALAIVSCTFLCADDTVDRGHAGGRDGLLTYPEALVLSAVVGGGCHAYVSWRERRGRRR
jgi:hypothetical protein